jgi:hypothetical protein
MVTLSIKSTQTATKNGTSKAGKPYSITEQDAWVELNGERRRIRVTLSDGAAPFPVGDYTVGEGSFYVGDFGQLQLGRLELVSIAAAVRKVG